MLQNICINIFLKIKYFCVKNFFKINNKKIHLLKNYKEVAVLEVIIMFITQLSIPIAKDTIPV